MRMMIPALFALFFSAVAAAQTTMKPDVKLTAVFDSIVQKEFKATEPGVSAIVVKKGAIIYKKGVGMADMELNVPVHADMIFRLGSITKQFTAVAILQLAAQGKLTLADPVTKYIPDFAIKEPVTIEQLLNHTSGIKSYTNVEKFWQQMRTDLSPREVIRLTENDSLEFKPGTQWNYNNTGYVILGYIIEKVSGMRYEKYVQQHLFAPAGMKNSYYGNESSIIRNRAKGYKREGLAYEHADYISMTLPYAAGSLISTVEDLWNWNKALYSYQLLSKEWVDKAITPHVLPDGTPTHYGFGLGISTVQGSLAIEHNGGINGFSTHALYMPGEEVFVAAFSNCDCRSPEGMVVKLAAAAMGKPYNFKALPLAEKDAKEYEGVYTNKGEERYIRWKNGKLTSQRGSGTVYVVSMYEKDKFFFADDFSFLEFQRNPEGKITGALYSNRTDKVDWVRTDKAFPQQRPIVAVAPELLKDLVGNYQLAPNFVLAVTFENGKLYGQATGQVKFEMLPYSATRFKVSIVDAEIEFKQNAEGKTESLILYQAGRAMPAKRQ